MIDYLPPAAVYNWIYQYSPAHKKGTTMVIQKDSEASKTQELQTRIANLERHLGQKQLALDYLETVLKYQSRRFSIS